MAVGGDITEVTYNHPTIGTATLLPKAGEDSTYDLGGFRSEDDQQMVDGGGNQIVTLTRNLWFFEVTISNDMETREDMEKMTALAADPVNADWTITNSNGVVYGGKGRPVGDLNFNGRDTTFTLKVQGGGALAKIG